MKLLIVLPICALVCMIRSAPSPSSTARQLILQDYQSDDDVQLVPDADEDENDSFTTTTTATTTTLRSTYVFPTRDRKIVPSRRPWLTTRSSSTTTTVSAEVNVDEYANEFEGDFGQFGGIRKFIKKLIEDFKKFIRNITGHDIVRMIQQFFSKRND